MSAIAQPNPSERCVSLLHATGGTPGRKSVIRLPPEIVTLRFDPTKVLPLAEAVTRSGLLFGEVLMSRIRPSPRKSTSSCEPLGQAYICSPMKSGNVRSREL